MIEKTSAGWGVGRAPARFFLLTFLLFNYALFVPNSEAAARSRALDENNAGVAALKRKDFDRAIAHLRSAHALDPGNRVIKRNLLRGLNARASEAAERGRIEDAERDYVEALELAPDDDFTIRQFAVLLNNRAVALLGERRLDEARPLFERALGYVPRTTAFDVRAMIRSNYSNFLTAEGDVALTEQDVERARTRYREALAYNPRHAGALAGLADLDYDVDRHGAALEGYRKALEATSGTAQTDLRAALEQRIDTLRQEMAIEADFLVIHDGQKRFLLTFPKTLPESTIARVLATLNEAYATVGRNFDFYPKRPVRVKIYTREQLGAIKDVPSWVVGLFDGKLRLLAEQMVGGRAQLRSSIYHEYTHAVIHLVGGEAVPSWLHEGLAQLAEPGTRVRDRDFRYMVARVRTGKTVSMAELNRPFLRNQSSERMSLIYRQSILLVHYLLEKHGWESVRRLLRETGRFRDFEAASVIVLGITPIELEADWKRWLLEREKAITARR